MARRPAGTASAARHDTQNNEGGAVAGGIEDLLRQVLAGQAATQAKLESLDSWVRDVAADTKAARDGMMELRTITEQQDLPGRISEVRREALQAVADLRNDVVHQNVKIRDDLGEVDERVKTLEDLRERQAGARSLVEWVVKHWPGLAALVVAAAAWLAEHLPKLKGG
jgi:phage shock protein A